MPPDDSHDAISSSLKSLHVSASPRTNSVSSKSQEVEVAESWEDEIEHGLMTVRRAATPKRPGTSDLPSAPPPTPASPAARSRREESQLSQPMYTIDGSLADVSLRDAPSTRQTGEERRPEKSTAVASRLIAAAIGQRPAPRTKEQREYDAAMKVQEKKRRDQAREDEARKKQEKEQAQKDIWGD